MSSCKCFGSSSFPDINRIKRVSILHRLAFTPRVDVPFRLHGDRSAVSGRILTQQYALIDALKDSSDLITFFPSEYATPFTDADLTSPYLRGTAEKNKVIERARASGVPVTVLKNATTPELLFGMP